MSGTTRDDDSSDYSRYAPKRFREPTSPSSAERPYVPSAPTAPLPRSAHQDRRTTSDFSSWPEPVPEPPTPPHRLEDGTSTLVGRIALVITFAAVVALVLIFAKPISQGVHTLFDSASRAVQTSKSIDLLTPNNVPSNDPVSPTTRVATAGATTPPAAAPAVQPPASPVAQPPAAQAPAAQPPATSVGQSSPTQQASLGQEPGGART